MCSRRKLTHLHTFSLLLESATKKEERNRSPAKKNFFTVPLNDSRPPAAKTHGRAVLLASSSPTRSVRTCTGGQIYYYLQGLSPTESKLPAANPYRYDNSLCHTCRPDYTGLGQTWACSLPGTGDFTWLCQIISQIKSNQIKSKRSKKKTAHSLSARGRPPLNLGCCPGLTGP